MSAIDSRTFNLNLVPSLVALLRHGSVGAAARDVGVSQSAMSHALAKLREHLGDPLLVPQGRRFVLSSRARQLAAELPEVLEHLERTLSGSASFDPKTAAMQVRIASVDYFDFTTLPSLVAYLREHAPGVRLSVERLTAASAEALQSGNLDVIFGGTGFVQGAGIEQLELFRDPFKVIARADHPIAKRRRLSLRTYLEAEHVVVRFEGRGVPVVDRLLASRGLQRSVGLHVPHFVSAPLVVAESDMICTVASAVAERAQALLGVAVLEPPLELPPARVIMSWPRSHAHDPARTWFRQLIVRGDGVSAALRRRIRAQQREQADAATKAR